MNRAWYRKRRAVMAAAARRRRSHQSNLVGPYYPHISSGLFVLEDTDTGLRFDIASNLLTVASGSGSYVAYLPQDKRGRFNPGRFVLVAE